MSKADNKDRIIALIEGESGSGKSFFVACLKNSVIYDVDLGGGLAEYDERIKKNGSERVEIASFGDILSDIRQRVKNNLLKETIVIDHVTGLHQEALLRHNPNQDSDYGRSNNKATYEWRQIREFARTFDANLFCVSHMKAEYERDKQVGKIADGAKNIEGDMHIVLKLENPKDDKGRKKYPSTAHVIKWRRDPDDSRGLPPESFKFTLQEFEKIHAANYQRQRENVILAKEETIKTLNNILALMDKEWAQKESAKWLKAAGGVESIDFLTEEQAQRCIEYVQKQIKGGK